MLDKFITSLSSEQKQQLLEALQTDLQSEPEPEPVSAPVKDIPRTVIQQADYLSPIKKTEGTSSSKEPVAKKKRINQFVDDGTEAKGEEFVTPTVQLAERKRPPVKKIKQVCSQCGKTVEIHPSHAREFFKCDKCIGV